MAIIAATTIAAGMELGRWAPLQSNEHRHEHERQTIGQARRRWVSTTQEASVDEGSASAVVQRG